jgi:hypothetical protein
LVTQRRSKHASFVEAAIEILGILDDGEWHRSEREIRGPLRPWVKEHMFGKVKSHFGIECRQVGGGPGSYFEWRSPRPRTHRYIRHRLEEGVSLEKAEATAVQAMAEGEHPSRRPQKRNGRTGQIPWVSCDRVDGGKRHSE